MAQPIVGIVMGSDSDWEVLQQAARRLTEFDVPFEARVVSAHRTPDLLFRYAEEAAGRGLRCIIAGAGGAAHLPGMLASKTTLPVLGVPVPTQAPPGTRLAALDRADARRDPGAHVRHRRGRRAERRPLRRGDPRPPGSEAREAAGAVPPGSDPAGARPPASAGARVILPGATLGVLGGGQLGRMFALRARVMGYGVLVLDPDPGSPAGQVADCHLAAAYTDHAALDQVAATCAAVTTEFENVPAETLERLARSVPVRPGASAVAVAQDRITEKTFLAEHGFRRPRRSARCTTRPRCAKPSRASASPPCSRPAAWATTERARSTVEHASGALAAFDAARPGAVRAGGAAGPGAGALGRAGAGSRRRGRPLPRRGEPAPRRDSGDDRRPGRGSRGARSRGAPAGRAAWRRRSTTSACSGSSCSSPTAAGSSSTRSRPGRTTPGTGRSTPAAPTSSSSRSAPSAACRSRAAVAEPGRHGQPARRPLAQRTAALARGVPAPGRARAPVRKGRGAGPGRKMGHLNCLADDPRRALALALETRDALVAT